MLDDNIPEKNSDNENITLSDTKLIVSTLLGFIIIITIIIFTISFLFKKGPLPTAQQNNKTTEISTPQEKKSATITTKKSKETLGETPETKDNNKIGPVFYTIKPIFITNIIGSRTRFLQVSVDIKVRDQLITINIGNSLPLIKQELNILFGSQYYDNLLTPEGKELLKKETLKIIKDVMEKTTGTSVGIEDVLFTEFVIS
jgi:flagellar FliL protein